MTGFLVAMAIFKTSIFRDQEEPPYPCFYTYFLCSGMWSNLFLADVNFPIDFLHKMENMNFSIQINAINA